MSNCLHDVHREVAALFAAAGCRTQQERQALAEEFVGPGPYDLAQAQLLMERLRAGINEPKEETPWL